VIEARTAQKEIYIRADIFFDSRLKKCSTRSRLKKLKKLVGIAKKFACEKFSARRKRAGRARFLLTIFYGDCSPCV